MRVAFGTFVNCNEQNYYISNIIHSDSRLYSETQDTEWQKCLYNFLCGGSTENVIRSQKNKPTEATVTSVCLCFLL